jgi:hypothetical protein
MGYDINWSANAGDPVLTHPLYLQFSNSIFGDIQLPNVQNALAGAMASRESAAVINYLSWLARTIALLG